MSTVLLTVSAMGLLMLFMAIGVIFKGKALKGSCGGIGGDCLCLEAGREGACAIAGRKYDDEPPPALRAHDGDEAGVTVYQ